MRTYYYFVRSTQSRITANKNKVRNVAVYLCIPNSQNLNSKPIYTTCNVKKFILFYPSVFVQRRQ